jgi:hypothetical protein
MPTTVTPPLAAEPAVAPPPTAVPFHDLGPGRCHAFLAGQEGAEGLCCGRRMKRRGGRSLSDYYCDEHRPLFVVKARR